MEVDRSRAGAWIAYSSFFKRAISAHLAYSTSVWMNLLATGAGYIFTVLVWNSALHSSARTPLFAYLALAFCVNFTMGVAFERYVGERIREGLIATDLLKPVDYTWLFFWQSLSDVVFQAFFGLAVLGVAWAVLGSAMAPASSQAACMSLFSLGLAFFVQFHLGFLFVQMIFATHSNYGPFTSRMFLHTAFSGIFAPLDMYPHALRAVALWLPFRHVVYTPCALWLGRLQGPEAWQALSSQAAWGLGLMLVSRTSFGLIRRHLTIQGG
jgi:ABC-2 type transport system permease protein